MNSFSIWQLISKAYCKNWCMSYTKTHIQWPDSLSWVTMTLIRVELTRCHKSLCLRWESRWLTKESQQARALLRVDSCQDIKCTYELGGKIEIIKLRWICFSRSKFWIIQIVHHTHTCTHAHAHTKAWLSAESIWLTPRFISVVSTL